MNRRVCLVIILMLFALIAVLVIERGRQTEIAMVRIGQTEVRAELAQTPEARAQGLSGRDALAADHGMLFVFPEAALQTFWMKDMVLPIDIIWINDDRVIGFVEQALPPHLSDGYVQQFMSPQPVNLVLEVPTGFVRHEDIKIGAPVEVRYNEK